MEHPDGIPLEDCPHDSKHELLESQSIHLQIVRIIRACDDSDVPYVLESPSPRHDPNFMGGLIYDVFGRSKNHGSLWDTTRLK